MRYALVRGLKTLTGFGLVLALILIPASAYCKDFMTPEQLGELRELGLTPETIALLMEHFYEHHAKGLEPALTHEEIKKLVNEGVGEDIIELLVRLDKTRLNQGSGTDEAGVRPADIRRFHRAGVSPEAIRLLLEIEINQRGGGRDPSAARVGRKIITKPDGSKSVVYYSWDPNRAEEARKRQEEEIKRIQELLKNIDLIIIKPPDRQTTD